MNKIVINFITEAMRIWKIGTDCRRKNFSQGENPERYLPGRYAFSITICNSNDATQSYTYEKAQETTNLLNRKKRKITLCFSEKIQVFIYFFVFFYFHSALPVYLNANFKSH